jgi:hypothetical protein
MMHMETQTRAVTMFNQSGDTTITWEEDQDEEMAAILQKKMDAGCTFFIINSRTGGRRKLTKPSEAMKNRHLAIPDEDLQKFVAAGKGGVIQTPSEPATVRRKARTGKEAAQHETIGLQPRAGG